MTPPAVRGIDRKISSNSGHESSVKASLANQVKQKNGMESEPGTTGVQVIYKIETIFVMDEKPFELQRNKKVNKNCQGMSENAYEKPAEVQEVCTPNGTA